MNKHILNDDQIKLLPFIKTFSADFYLVGGTAIALNIGHRRSIDFDLFTPSTFGAIKIRNKILQSHEISHTFMQGEGDLTILVDRVKITFFHFPYSIEHNTKFEVTLPLPDLLTLGAMKAFALGKRAKWKDYVDLYFIFQQYSLKEVTDKARSIFESAFNEKLFRTQLSYFEDIDHSEEIDYISGFEKKDSEVQAFLENISLS